MATKANETTAVEFKPYIAPATILPEFNWRSVLFGAIFGIIFGAVTVYVGLRAGLTVSASVPIAVLSISLLRAFGKASILENNMVQTIGSAGESVAAGVIFTLPALIFMGFPLEYSRIFLLALIGGWLGVLFMIPLRRQLIVKEHGNLLYPEGAACADVLVAGDKGGSFAGRVLWGLGLGGVYTFLMAIAGMWRSRPLYEPKWLPGASFRAEITSEYLGVGYIIGPRIAGTIFAGGVFSWLVLMPAIKFFGENLADPLYPSTIPIAKMSPGELWENYIRPMGAGAVAMAGLLTLAKTMPTILGALKAGLKSMGASQQVEQASDARTERDLSMKWVVIGSAVIVAMMWLLLAYKPVPNADTGALANLIAALFVVVFGFLFVTVSSRICGLIGTSANPVSGMTIATLMATCAMFLVAGWTGGNYAALALTIGGVVCIAAANAGATSQDLKTGYLVGATPRRQQVGLMIGVMASVFVIGWTLTLMNRGLSKYTPLTDEQKQQLQIDVAQLPDGVKVENPGFDHSDGRRYVLLNAFGSKQVANGKYLYDESTKQVEIKLQTGIGSEDAAAPQAQLMATLINGMLNRRLPWRLVALGVFLVIAVELLGIRSLSFAVGSYLGLHTTLAIFCGGLVRWLAERGQKKAEHAESEVSPGSLYASGLIAAGGVIGLLGIIVKVLEDAKWLKKDLFSFGPSFWDGIGLTSWAHRTLPAPYADSVPAHLVAVAMFIVLGVSMYIFARKKL